ncbi:hypothetical protein ACLHWE_13635 [Vagococcus salmoninarum]
MIVYLVTKYYSNGLSQTDKIFDIYEKSYEYTAAHTNKDIWFIIDAFKVE